MSNLKYKNVDELIACKLECDQYIRELKSKLSGQQTQLEWIKKYIFEKTPVELSIEEIESRLWHRVILK